MRFLLLTMAVQMAPWNGSTLKKTYGSYIRRTLADLEVSMWASKKHIIEGRIGFGVWMTMFSRAPTVLQTCYFILIILELVYWLPDV